MSMSVRLLRVLTIACLAGLAGCAAIAPQQVTADLPVDARCTVRVWDRQNPADAASQVDIWGTIASADAEKIVLVAASTEPVAGKPLLEDAKALPPAIWAQRLKSHGTGKFTIRRDQVLAVEVLSDVRVKQIMNSYPPGTRCNIRICDAARPYDRTKYQDVWGTVSRSNERAIELKDARQEVVAQNTQPGADRRMTDAVRAAHLKTAGGDKFIITPDRIISIDWLETPPERIRASDGAWDIKSLLF
jgi:hypothetical protein